MKRGIVLFFLVTGLLNGMLISASADDHPKQQRINVVSTIKPIQSIVVAIVGDLADASQLIPDNASPHFYSFKPSDLRAIKKADIIFRIDEGMEATVNPALALRKKNVPLISLADDADVKLLPFAENHEDEEESHDDHGHGNIDFHIWTSPENAIAMAKVITEEIIKINPENAKIYQTNLEEFTQAIQTASTEIKEQLALVKNKPYVVFHNSWQYFSDYYGLREAIVLSSQHGISAGVKTMRETRKKIVSEGVVCVFSDPGIRTGQVNALIKKLNIKTVEIDVLQSKFAADNRSYMKWLKKTGADIKTCLE